MIAFRIGARQHRVCWDRFGTARENGRADACRGLICGDSFRREQRRTCGWFGPDHRHNRQRAERQPFRIARQWTGQQLPQRRVLDARQGRRLCFNHYFEGGEATSCAGWMKSGDFASGRCALENTVDKNRLCESTSGASGGGRNAATLYSGWKRRESFVCDSSTASKGCPLSNDYLPNSE